MSLKTFTILFQDFSIDPKLGLKDYSLLYKSGSRLKNFLINKNVFTGIKSGRTPSRFNEDYRNGEYDFLTMQDVDTMTFSINTNCVDKITDYAIEEEKTLHQTKAGALIVSNAMTLGLSFIADRPVYINQNIFEVDIDDTKANKRFILWYLNLVIKPLFQTTYTAKYLSKDELGRIKIPLITLTTQNEIVAQIKPIEDRIAYLRDSIIPAQEIINLIFAREFGFDENLHHEFGKGMTANTQQADDKTMRVFSIPSHELSRSSIVRNSARFHNPPTKKLMDFIDTIDTFYVNDVVSSYEKGIQPQYDTEGDIPVIKIGSLKNGYIDFSEPELVSQKFFDELDEKKKLKTGDIIICATGKGSLGKIDYYDYEREAITAVDNYILRIDESRYNPLFFVYFFRSILGYFQIERDYTGATNQIHLYRDQISQFKIPNISLAEQLRIVDEITVELNAQTSIADLIVHERAKIDQIIEQAIA